MRAVPRGRARRVIENEAVDTLGTPGQYFVGDVAAGLRERTRLVKHTYAVEQPLAVVQIDQTVADVFIVDPLSRDCIGRPTLTVPMDVATDAAFDSQSQNSRRLD
jgi:hypothetical protein